MVLLAEPRPASLLPGPRTEARAFDVEDLLMKPMTEWPKILEAESIQTGHLSHAVVNDGHPANFHRTMPNVLITYRRALCGVGVNGLRVRLDEDKEPVEWGGGRRPCRKCERKITTLPRARDLLIAEITERVRGYVAGGHYEAEAAALGVVWFLEGGEGLLAPDWKEKIERMKR